jgi:hypothetical protein
MMTSEMKSKLTPSMEKVVGKATEKQRRRAVVLPPGSETVGGADAENDQVQHQVASEDVLSSEASSSDETSSSDDKSSTTIKLIGQCLTTFPRHLLDCEYSIYSRQLLPNL